MSHKGPDVTARRHLVQELVTAGFTDAMIAEAIAIAKHTAVNDRQLWRMSLPQNPFAVRLSFWLHWKREGNLGADLEELVGDESAMKRRIVAVLTARVMADLNPHVSLLVESLIRPAVDCGGPYEWLFAGVFPVLPSVEELWADVLGTKIDTPATVEEAVLRFVTHVQRRYHDRLAYHGRGGDTSFVQTPIAVRECIDNLRAEKPEIGELWDAWIAIIEQRRVHSHLKKDRDALRRLDQEERRRHAELHAICVDASPTIAAFSTWRSAGYMGMLQRDSQ